MKIFISGGCKNGKSSLAEKLSLQMRKKDAPLYYLATMIPSDNEDKDRIAKHQKARAGRGFITAEAGRDMQKALETLDTNGVFLLDSVTALLANEMFPANGQINAGAYIKTAGDMSRMLDVIDCIVIVSDYIYADARVYDGLTEEYRRGLAYIDKKLAFLCDVVLEACGGNYIVHKGGETLKGLLNGHI